MPVESVTVQGGAQKFRAPDYFGHEFHVRIKGSGLNIGSLQWWERTNRPYIAAIGWERNRWIDLAGVAGVFAASNVFQPWRIAFTAANPGQIDVTLTDPPDCQVLEDQSAYRYLDIKFGVIDANGNGKVAAVKQIVFFEKGTQVDWNFQVVLSNYATITARV